MRRCETCSNRSQKCRRKGRRSVAVQMKRARAGSPHRRPCHHRRAAHRHQLSRHHPRAAISRPSAWRRRALLSLLNSSFDARKLRSTLHVGLLFDDRSRAWGTRRHPFESLWPAHAWGMHAPIVRSYPSSDHRIDEGSNIYSMQTHMCTYIRTRAHEHTRARRSVCMHICVRVCV